MASIRKRGNTFQISVSLGYDTANDYAQRRKFFTFTPPPDTPPQKALKLAKQAAVDFERKVRGLPAFDENVKLSDLWAWYVENIAPRTLREHTFSVYKRVYRVHIEPVFGAVKLRDIAPARIDAMYTHLLKEGVVSTYYYVRDGYPFMEKLAKPVTHIYADIHVSIKTIRTLRQGNGTPSRDVCERLAHYMGEP